jgi:ABC-type branched-subunit amino acid transport system ATPase component
VRTLLGSTPGEFVGIIGPNGAGKTTTLRSLLGLIPSKGRVRILGRDVAGWPTHRIVRLGVGYVPEDREVFADLTVRENLRRSASTGLTPATTGPRRTRLPWPAAGRLPAGTDRCPDRAATGA